MFNAFGYSGSKNGAIPVGFRSLSRAVGRRTRQQYNNKRGVIKIPLT